jgi:hypothetical protein
MDEWEIATALRGARPHPLRDAIPDVLRPWLLDAEWDRERLWEIDHPVSVLPIAALRWSYALPWWRDEDGVWFRMTPRQVLREPGKYVEHEHRIAHADLTYPVHVLRRHGRWVPLDGIHRLVKADVELRRRIHVVPLGPAQLARIIVRAERVRS